MPLNTYPNVGSQIERALKQYFIVGYQGTTAMPNQALSNKGIFLTLDNADRGMNPLRTILAHESKEMVEYLGSEIYQVTIVDQFDATVQPGQTDAQSNRVSIDFQVGNMQYLMMLTSNNVNLDQTCRNITDAGRSLAVYPNGGAVSAQDAADNADMAQFTCLLVVPRGSRRGKAADEGAGEDKTYWREVRMFEITAAPITIAGYSNNPNA